MENEPKPKSTQDSKEDKGEVLSAIVSASDAVIGTAVLAFLGAWGGGFIDEKMGISGTWSIILSILGVGLGLFRMVKKALDAEKKESKP